MNHRLARWLTRLYSPAFRARYAEEFTTFLEARPATLAAMVDVIVAAIGDRLSFEGGPMDGRQRSVILMLWAWLAAVCAGVNFYFSVDDTPLQLAMRDHVVLSISFRLVAAAACLGAAAIVAIATPAAYFGLRAANPNDRRPMVGLLMAPVGIAVVTLAWLLVAAVWVHSRWGAGWVPLPWDVAGDWRTPAGWPPQNVRWALSIVTCGLLGAGIGTMATSVGRLFTRLRLSMVPRIWVRRASILFACAQVAMTIGVIGWGLGAQSYAATAFHARNGGFFATTDVVSWAVSAIVFIAASAMAIYSVRLTMAPQATLARVED